MSAARRAHALLALASAVVAASLATSVAAAAATGPVPAATGTRGAGPEPVLLALGDSLASGYQPTYGRNPPPVDPATGYRDVGYPGGYASDLAAARHLALVDLACPGETTVSMTSTPAQPGCAGTYRAELHASSQLAAATSYLAGHPGRVALVTIDLGANDVDACVSASGASLSCLSSREAEVVSRLPAILATLRTALSRYDPRARLVGMNYYDPFLGVAYSPGGLVGTVGATLSLAAIASFDRRLGTVYAHAHAAVADVASAFHTAAALPLLSYRGHRLPADVVYVCRWTWMCPAPHSAIHQDIHATTVGYRVIASALERVLGPA